MLNSFTMTIKELLASSYDLKRLTLVDSFLRESAECQDVKEVVMVFIYNKMDEEGKFVNETITVTKAQEVEVKMVHALNNKEHSSKLL